MSVRVDIIAGFSEATQSAPATWERITGGLGNAGYTPKGKPGGGVGSAHYGVGPIASVVMSTGASIPSEAAEVVKKLEGLRAVRPSALSSFALVNPGVEQVAIVPPGTTLRAYLEKEITRWSAPTAEMLAQLREDRPLTSIWTMELIPAVPCVNLSVYLPDPAHHFISFFPDGDLLSPQSVAAIRRKVELTLPILKIAGDLLRDTLSRQSPSSPPEPEQRGSGKDASNPSTDTSAVDSSPGKPMPGPPEPQANPASGSTNENADSFRGEPAPTHDQDQNSIPGTHNTPKGKREKRKPQASSSCGLGWCSGGSEPV